MAQKILNVVLVYSVCAKTRREGSPQIVPDNCSGLRLAVNDAAGTLRRFLEYVAAHLSDKLRARIEFHGDAQYDLGELLPGVINTWNKLLAKAQEAAQSWDKPDDVIAITKRQKEFKGCVERSQVNQSVQVPARSIHDSRSRFTI